MTQITVNQEDIDRIKRDLKVMSDEVPVVLARTINRTVDSVSTEAGRQVRSIYGLTAARVKKNFKLRRASKVNLSGQWTSSGRPVGLLQFVAKQNTRGVSVKVMAAGTRKTIAGAFIRTPSSPRTDKTGPQVFWREKSGDRLVGRYPIHRLEGPRVEDALSKPAVQQALQAKADSTLATRLAAEANYIISKGR